MAKNFSVLPYDYFYERAKTNVMSLIGLSESNVDFYRESDFLMWSVIDQIVPQLAYEEALIAYQNQFLN